MLSKYNVKVAMSDNNFKHLRDCCSESHCQMLVERSRMVVVSSKSVQ